MDGFAGSALWRPPGSIPTKKRLLSPERAPLVSPAIGVDPAHQGKGTPAYLESTNSANIPLYERHGFEVLATIQVGSSPPIFPMLRSAR